MKKRILVEGQDDDNIIKTLIYNYGLDGVFDLKQKDGISKLFDTLPDELEATDMSCLGVVIDADTEVPSYWGKIDYANEEGWIFLYSCRSATGRHDHHGKRPCSGRDLANA